MSIEVLPLGVKCSLACDYCYQTPLRNAGNALDPDYDMEAMQAALITEGYKFTLFGGEPLLLPLPDLEELWRFGLETFGAAARKHGDNPNAVQTHGAEITEAHVALFQRYGVGVGMSIDGPGELNDARWSGSVERTRETTRKSLHWLDRLLELRHPVSLITTLTRMNASPERLPILLDWFRGLSAKGLRHVNLHLLEVDNPGVRDTLALTTRENADALLTCARLQADLPLRFAPLGDMVQLLKGEDQWNPRSDGSYASGTSCTWNKCDAYTTAAVHGVDGQGHRGNCGRTCKDGPFWEKADTVGYERYLALAYADFADGGCKGCRFFSMCGGHCPGEGDFGDWRSKTEHCGVLLEVFGALEAELIRQGVVPLSVSPMRSQVEQRQIALWQAGQNHSLTRIRADLRTGAAPAPLAVSPGDQPHGDVAHGDAPHGDHDDAARPIVTHGDHTDVAGTGVAWQHL